MPSMVHVIAGRVHIGLILMFAIIIQSEVAALDHSGNYFTNPPEYGDYPDNDANYTVEYGEIPYFTWRTNLTSINLVLHTIYDQGSYPLMTSFLDVEYSKDLTYPDGSFTSKYGPGFYLVIEDAETDYAVAMSMNFYIISPDAMSSTLSTLVKSSSETKPTTKPTSPTSSQSSISSITATTSTSALIPPSTFDALEPTTSSTSAVSSNPSPSSDAPEATSIHPQAKDTSSPASPSSKAISIAGSIGSVCAAIMLGVAIYIGVRRQQRRRRLRDARATHPPTNSEVTERSGRNNNYSVLPMYSPSDDIKARLSSPYSNNGVRPHPSEVEDAVELPAQTHSAEVPG